MRWFARGVEVKISAEHRNETSFEYLLFKSALGIKNI